MRKNSFVKICCISFAIVLLFFGTSVFAQSDPDPNRFIDEINTFRQWDAKNAVPDHPVLFIGSSSIRKWKTHDSFPDLPVMNRGFGGAHISDMLYFIEDIALKYPRPSCVVFYCGDNDVAGGKSARRVLNDYRTFVERFHQKYPGVPFIYIPIKPSLSRWQLWEQMRKANALIKAYSQEQARLFYADTATPMLGSDGKPKPDLFVEDGLHLNHRGYELWTGIVRKAIEESQENGIVRFIHRIF